jgi:MraZ protein
MFRGANAINLDSKGRVAIPTKYRQALLDDCGGNLVCTVDIQQSCLLLYPLSEWEEIELKLTIWADQVDADMEAEQADGFDLSERLQDFSL